MSGALEVQWLVHVALVVPTAALPQGTTSRKDVPAQSGTMLNFAIVSENLISLRKK